MKIVCFFCACVAVGALLGCVLSAQFPAVTHEKFSSAINISLDLGATANAKSDPVNGGRTDFYASRVHFKTPTGMRTRLLRVYGDAIFWPRNGVIEPGKSLEAGFGLKTSRPDGDPRIDFPGFPGVSPYANSMCWWQTFLTAESPGARIQFDTDVSAGGLLETDGILISQPFIALDDTNVPAYHVETTYVAVWEWIKE